MTAIANSALERIKTIASTAVQPKLDARIASEYSVARAVRSLLERKESGFEWEVSKDLLRASGARLRTANSILTPRQCLSTRADTVAVAAQGGFLTETVNGEVVPGLGSASVLARCGATILHATSAGLNIPVIRTPVVANWISSETTQIAEADQVFGQMALTGHTVAAYTEISRLLLLQTGSDDFIRRDLSAGEARAVDKGGLVGTGIGGQPLGIANVVGTNTFVGNTATLAALTGAALATGDALMIDSKPAFVSGRTAANVLRNRQELAGSTKTLWTGPISEGLCVDYPGYSTSAIGANNLYFGNFAFLVIALFGDVEIAVNPYANFQSGLVGIRIMSTVDVGVTFPGAFSVNSNAIT